jgi:hypothetical protein
MRLCKRRAAAGSAGRRWLLPFALSAAAFAARAQDIDAAKLAQVKAAYVVNFLRYAQWPAGAAADTPLHVAVLAADPVAADLEAVAQHGQPVNGRPLLVQRIALPAHFEALVDEQQPAIVQSLRQSELVYIGELPPPAVAALLHALQGAGVLTVGEPEGFAAQGGMLGLVLQQNHVVFDANPEAIRLGGMYVSANVLKLAHLVGKPLVTP